MRSFLESVILGVCGFILGYLLRPLAAICWGVVWSMINIVLGRELPFRMQATGDDLIRDTVFLPALLAVLAMWIWHMRRKRKKEAGLYIS